VPAVAEGRPALFLRSGRPQLPSPEERRKMMLQSEVRRRRPGRAARNFERAPILLGPEQWLRVGKLLRLTPRQLAVAELLCAEYSQKDMARQLGVCVDTVRTHLRGLYTRLQVRSRVGVVIRLVLAERELPGTERLPVPVELNGGRTSENEDRATAAFNSFS
jgi:DNA-binding CsgD family transcriptional regulator